MLDIPGCELLDKDALIGGCTRLAVPVDIARLQREVGALPADFWGTAAGRVGVHRDAESVFLRGFAPAQGEKPVEDRPALAHLPYVRELIHERMGARPMRCLLAALPAGGFVGLHVDRPPYFGKTIRVHFPVTTNPDAHMFCAGLLYSMKPGEVWALNNSTVHAVWNAHASDARIHLICDFLPAPALLEVLRGGERHLGRHDATIEQRFAASPR